MSRLQVVMCVIGLSVAAQAPVADLIGRGVLSTGEPRSAFRGTFTHDGQELYFFKAVAEGEEYRIFAASKTPEGWSVPRQVDLGGSFSDLYPTLSADGRRLVFSSYRPLPGAGAGARNAHLWMADRQGSGWGVPRPLAAVNVPGSYHAWAHLDDEGHLYFRRVSPDWQERETLMAEWDGTAYASPRVVEAVSRWTGWRDDARVSGGVPGPGGRTFLLDVAVANPATGAPASDIFVTCGGPGGWSEPEPLRGVNAPGFDTFPFVSRDGRDLYFVRDFQAFLRIPLDAALPEACRS